MRRLPALLGALVGLVAVGTVLGVLIVPHLRGGSDRPDIVVIVLDTVRRDHLGVYGYSEATSPGLDAWAAAARVYDEARSVSPWTLPAHASLFTGLLPADHGARGVPPGSGQQAMGLGEGVPTVAEALATAGYRTRAVVANRAFLGPRWGLDRGFDLYLCDELRRGPTVGYATAETVTDQALAMLKGRDEAPVFLFVNYLDAHAPYVARPEHVRDAAALKSELLPYEPGWAAHARFALQTGNEPASEVRQAWSAAYDAELRYLDRHLTRLLDALPSHGVDDDDLVVILSDHGEYFGEHGLVEHSKGLHREVTDIPLLARGPGFAAGRDPAPVQTVDVTAWVLDAAGVPRLAKQSVTDGVQISELYWGRPRDLRDPRMRARFARVVRRFVRDDHALWLGDDGTDEGFDLGSDPGETAALTAAPWLDALRAEANAWLAAHPAVPGSVVDAELEALKELGYVE